MSTAPPDDGTQEEQPEQLGGFPIKVMLQPDTCGVAKFDNGQRLITMTQGPFELSWPLGPNEAEQLSKELHVSKIVTPTDEERAGLVLPGQ
jgi:hypothetical protein